METFDDAGNHMVDTAHLARGKDYVLEFWKSDIQAERSVFCDKRYVLLGVTCAEQQQYPGTLCFASSG